MSDTSIAVIDFTPPKFLSGAELKAVLDQPEFKTAIEQYASNQAPATKPEATMAEAERKPEAHGVGKASLISWNPTEEIGSRLQEIENQLGLLFQAL
jgi:hypothetical protein